MKIRLIQETIAKLRPSPAAELSRDEKFSLPNGTAFDVSAIERERGHLKITLFLYEGHCIVLPPQPNRRRINQTGLELIKSFEGCKLEAYLCPAKVPTIGYGSTLGVSMGDRITQAEAEALLIRDLERYEKAVELLVKVPISDNQFSALVSFAFNVGSSALERSTLLRFLNNLNYTGAASELLKWNKAGGRVLPGLTRRREAERALFLKRAE